MNVDACNGGQPRLVSLGEILIDFTPAGSGFDSDSGNPLFVQNPGGAPANVLACFAKLGGSSSFIGAVGNDAFGLFLKNALEQAGVDASGLAFKEDALTTLAFVNLSPSGDRSFTFYRRPGADTRIAESDIPAGAFEGASVFHFGSLSMTDEPARSATFAAIERARAAGAIISFDPNWRPSLWTSEEAASSAMREGVMQADLLKVSEEEAVLISGEKDRMKAGSALAETVPLVVMTLGPEGCIYFRKGHTNESRVLSTFPVDVLDTTGSGDAFWGAFLYFLLVRNFAGVAGGIREALPGILSALPACELLALCSLANAAGSLCASKKGAIPALPTREEIEGLALSSSR